MALGIELRKVHLKPRGKNSKVAYQWRCLMHRLAPTWWLQHRSRQLLDSLDSRPDKDYIHERVDYYCKLVEKTLINGQYTIGQMHNNLGGARNYYRDFFEYSRFFNPVLKVDTKFGDNRDVPTTPSIVKSRPIAGQNANCVVCNLDKVRHFVFLNDKRSFESKENRAIFRGAAHQVHRQAFMNMYFGSEWVDCGDTGARIINSKWNKPQITLYDHLKYKFIISIEGNDVASNLKWVMSSNSIAVMRKPKFETWFMEGTLIPNYHYIEIQPDYSDLPERLQYYIDHPEEAKKIIQNAHEFVNQFQDKDREDLIHMLVLRKYFSLTNLDKKLMK